MATVQFQKICRAVRSIIAIEIASFSVAASAGDWPMLGRDKTRNAVSPEKNAPVEWDIKTGRNIKWKAELRSITVSEPICVYGLFWIGTNNDSPRDAALKSPGGILACLRERDGVFLYQHYSTVTNHPLQRRSEFGMTGSPMV